MNSVFPASSNHFPIYVAPGQVINFDKSSVYFSQKTSVQKLKSIQDRFQVKDMEMNGATILVCPLSLAGQKREFSMM